MSRSPFQRSSSGILAVLCILGYAVVGGASDLKPQAKHSQNRPEETIKRAAGTELLHEATSASASAHPTISSASLGSAGQPKLVWMQVTAYCGCKICCGSHAHGITASGRPISYNGGQFVAADTHLFKFGTKIQVPGYADGKAVEVIDRGGAIRGHHIDLFFPTHEQAKAWGKKWVQVAVWE